MKTSGPDLADQVRELTQELIRARAELQEALDMQSATRDVLSAVSRSPADLKRALEVLAAAAARVCQADDAHVYLLSEGAYRMAACVNPDDDWVDYISRIPISVEMRGSVTARAARELRTVHVPDTAADPEHDEGLLKAQKRRTVISAPLILDGVAVGVITLNRRTVAPFTPRQIELLTSFADQAVIAIANASLLEQVQDRSKDLADALEQQTATAEVLKVISRSAFAVESILSTLVRSAVQLCGVERGLITIGTADEQRLGAAINMPAKTEAFLRANPRRPGRETIVPRVLLSRQVEQIPDILEDPEYVLPNWVAPGQSQAVLGVPMLRDDAVEGVFVLIRDSAGFFSERQVELVKTFADQAVIALYNARLLGEVRAKTRDLEEALAQQTATADVLRVISRSAFDLDAVLRTLTDAARALSGAATADVMMRDGDLLRLRASSGCDHGFVEYMTARPSRAGRETLAGRVLQSGEAVQIPDVLADPEYDYGAGPQVGNYRSMFGAPLLRNGMVEGVFTLMRPEPGAFTPRQIELVRAFSDQAVIAIENARLFNEVEARTRELQESLDDLRKAQDRLVQTEKLASLGQLTAGIAHEIKNPLNFINNFSDLSVELVSELRELLAKALLRDDVLGQAEEIVGLLHSNLEKVTSHGKRADSIVRNMLLHARSGSGERRQVDVNALVEESLNLAYHGACTQMPGFAVTLQRDFDPAAGKAELLPQEITRVLLNLISNGFYAVRSKARTAEPGYEPRLVVTTNGTVDTVTIRVHDNGAGMPDEVKEKIFNPFYTTKPPGEGTGLGLSLSHDIIVKQHGGRIDVATEPGSFTEFTILLPRGER